MKKSYRFGVKLSWPIANAGIFVIDLDGKQAIGFANAVGVIEGILMQNGFSSIASKIVFEKREERK